MSEHMDSEHFYIVSLKNTDRQSRYITVWRADAKGYAWPLSWAGRYPRDEVDRLPDYYNNHESTMAVPCEILDAIATAPVQGEIDNDAGPVIFNTPKNWKAIRKSALTERATG